MPRKRPILDDVCRDSLALREMVRQRDAIQPEAHDATTLAVAALTGEHDGSAGYDLIPIWRAALADDGCEDTIGRRRWMSPRRYVNNWPHHVEVLEEPGDGRILVDRGAAFHYTMLVDMRVMEAIIDHHTAARKAAARADPIGNAVASARGGGFGMMFARIDSRHLGLDDDEFNRAVMERAKQEADGLDEYAAEKLLSEVRQAIEGAPGIEVVEVAE